MSEEKKCVFCGSEELLVVTPYVELNSEGEYVAKKTWCCKQQAQNAKFAKLHDEDVEDVEKW